MARFEVLQPVHGVGKSTVVPSSFSPDCESANQLIDALWREVLQFVEGGVDEGDLVRFAITTPADDVVPPLLLNYTAAVITSGVSHREGGEHVELTGGAYVVFSFSGALRDLDEFYRWCYLEELPRLGLTTRDGQHLEKILSSPQDEFIEVEAWIPIPPEAQRT